MVALAKLVERFTESDIDGEIIVMRLDNGEFFALSETAAAAWRLIDGKRDRAALLAELVVEFAADESQIATDVDELLGRLKDSKLIAGD
jgi:pyrroloquinoline quinone biosynthesis protein D